MSDTTGWDDYLETLDFVQKEADRWKDSGLIAEKAHVALTKELAT